MGNAVDAKNERNDPPPSRSARLRGRCAWVCWRAGPIGFVWVVLANTGIAPGLVAATEGFAGLMIVLVLLFGQAWTWLYVSGKPFEDARKRKQEQEQS